jgi:hypothetical protein
MHLQRPVRIAAEIEWILDEPDVAAAADCRVLAKELVRENEGDFHMNLERKAITACPEGRCGGSASSRVS